jgi:fatty acid desaturase (delta-4 desaturase)
MIDLGIGRDATVMFESMHVRVDWAERALQLVPKGPSVEKLESQGYVFDRPQESWATPGQSELYSSIRQRIVDEILRPMGRAEGPGGARGVPWWHVACVFCGWLSAAVYFVWRPCMISACLLGLMIAWVGLAIQHTANHGGLVRNPRLGYLLGLTNDVCAGGSSLVWRYHHQCSHHVYCNDIELDQDAHSSFPLLRLDKSQQLKAMHKLQFVYAPPLFCALYFSIQLQDIMCLWDARTFLVNFKGTSRGEMAVGIVLKVIHYCWFLVLPVVLHGFWKVLLPCFVVTAVGSFALSALFIISHNIECAKEAEVPAKESGDWAQYQIETSSSWGGCLGSFCTGGLNLQIEHHLFPALPHHLYTRAQVIVKEECAKRQIRYNGYGTLFANFFDHLKFLFMAGRPGHWESKVTSQYIPPKI